MRALSDKMWKVFTKNAPKNINFGCFLAIFQWTIFISCRWEHAKMIFHQNNVRNVFSNIELPLGYNIMTLEYVLERTWKEIAKNMWKKFKVPHFRHFFFGGGQLVYERHNLVCTAGIELKAGPDTCTRSIRVTFSVDMSKIT